MSTKTKPSLKLGSFCYRTNLVLLGTLLLGLVLRVVALDFQPLWWDEGYSMFFATRDLPTMLARTSIDIHPPLYYVLLKGWILFFGKNVIAIRLMSVLIGVLTIPMVYVFTRKVASPLAASIAALFVASSPFFIYYSQEVRMYGLVALLCLVSTYLFIRLLETGSQDRNALPIFALYILTSAAALYTQYFAAFILSFHIAVAFLITLPRGGAHLLHRSPLARLVAAWFLILLLYLPWLAHAAPELVRYVTAKVVHEAYPSLDPITYATQHLIAFSLGHQSSIGWLSSAAVPMLILGLLGFLREPTRVQNGQKSAEPPRLLIALYLAVPVALGYIVNVIYPFHPLRFERLLLIAAPPFLVFVALGLYHLWRHRILLIALTIGVVLATSVSLLDFYTTARYPQDDYRPLISEMRSLAQPGDILLAIYPWQIGYWESYYSGAPLTVLEAPSVDWINDYAKMGQDLDAIATKSKRVWIPALQTLGHILEDKLDGYLRSRSYVGLDTWFGTTRLEMFAVEADPPQAENAITVGNTSAKWGTSKQTKSGAGVLPVWFEWSEIPRGISKLSLRLLDSRGALWAQEDREISIGRQRIALAIPLGTPPGEYNLTLYPYAGEVRSQDTTGGISLGQVRIEAPDQPNLAAIPQRLSVPFANGMNLVGFAASSKVWVPGRPQSLDLYWQAAKTVDKTYDILVDVTDSRGGSIARYVAPPAKGIYATDRWTDSEVIRDPQVISLPGNIPDGTYKLSIGVIDPSSKNKVPAADGRQLVGLTDLRVIGRIHYFGTPSPSTRADVRFGEIGRLVGYDLQRGNKELALVLYWQALGNSETSFKVFAHLLDAKGEIAGQDDQIPGDTEYPTTGWVSGEYMLDKYQIPIKTDIPASVEIGMYDPATGARLPVFDRNSSPIGDKLILPLR